MRFAASAMLAARSAAATPVEERTTRIVIAVDAGRRSCGLGRLPPGAMMSNSVARLNGQEAEPTMAAATSPNVDVGGT